VAGCVTALLKIDVSIFLVKMITSPEKIMVFIKLDKASPQIEKYFTKIALINMEETMEINATVKIFLFSL
jgi:hypothetical protein